MWKKSIQIECDILKRTEGVQLCQENVENIRVYKF